MEEEKFFRLAKENGFSCGSHYVVYPKCVQRFEIFADGYHGFKYEFPIGHDRYENELRSAELSKTTVFYSLKDIEEAVENPATNAEWK